MCTCVYRFGTFLCNSNQERHRTFTNKACVSLWAYLDAQRGPLLNSTFVETTEVSCSLFGSVCVRVYVRVCVCACVRAVAGLGGGGARGARAPPPPSKIST